MSRRKTRKNLRSVFQWHRYIGLTAFLFVMMLVVTGIMLNHTERLTLDQTYIKSDLLLDWYGIDSPQLDIAFRTANHSIIQIGERVYMDRRPLDDHAAALRGAVEAGGLIVVAIDGEVLLLTPQGKLVERLGDAQGVPSRLRAIGRTQGGRVVVDAAHGLHTTDQDFLSWQRYAGKGPVAWSQAQPPPRALVQDLQRHYRAHILPMERVMLDLHSGRILGSWGVFVIDAAAVLLFFLGISGCWLWYERYQKRKAHQKKGLRSLK
jgi:hypothetical protein